jgi:hypothetical protein
MENKNIAKFGDMDYTPYSSAIADIIYWVNQDTSWNKEQARAKIANFLNLIRKSGYVVLKDSKVEVGNENQILQR